MVWLDSKTILHCTLRASPPTPPSPLPFHASISVNERQVTSFLRPTASQQPPQRQWSQGVLP